MVHAAVNGHLETLAYLFQVNWYEEEGQLTKREAMQQAMVVAAAMGHREVSNRNKSRLLFSSAEMFKKPLSQTVWTLFASILNSSVMLGNYLQQMTSADDILRCIFSWPFKG